MRTAVFAILISLTVTYVAGQEKDSAIKDIEQKILSIDQDTSYKIITLYNEAFLDSGFINQPAKGYGQLTGYFKNGTIHKIREFIGIKLLSDMATTDYYYLDGKLIFVHESEIYNPDIFIDSAGTIDQRKPGPDFEGKYYFNKDKVISTTTNGQQQLLPNEMFFDSQSKEGQLLYSAQKYINLLTEKNKQ